MKFGKMNFPPGTGSSKKPEDDTPKTFDSIGEEFDLKSPPKDFESISNGETEELVEQSLFGSNDALEGVYDPGRASRETHQEKMQKLREAVSRFDDLRKRKRRSDKESSDNASPEDTSAEEEPTNAAPNSAEDVPSGVPAAFSGEKGEDGKEPLSADILAARANVSAERNAMHSAEEEYLTAYRAYHGSKKLFKGQEPDSLKALKTAYDQTRITYADALEASVVERMKTRPKNSDRRKRVTRDFAAEFSDLRAAGKAPKDENGKEYTFAQYKKIKTAEYNDQVLERYNRLVRFNEIIKPTAEKKIQVRTEALDAKGQNIFWKGVGMLGKMNQGLEKQFGKNGAKVVRAAAGVLILSGGVALIGSFAGTASVVGLGWAASKFGKSLAGMFIGGAAGEFAANSYELLRGRKAQTDAQENLKKMGRSDDLSLDMLDQLDSTREKLTSRAQDATLAKKKAMIRALVAFGVGAGSAAVIANLESMHHLTDAAVSAGPAHPEVPPSISPEGGVTPESAQGPTAPIDTHLAPNPSMHGGPSPSSIESSSPASPVSGAPGPHASVPEAVHTNVDVKVSIDHPGDGADRLFTNLRAKFPNAAAAPEHIQKILAMKPDQFSTHYGFEAHGQSLVMHEGDTFEINNKGELLFVPKHGAAHTLIDAAGKDHSLDALKVHAPHHAEAAHQPHAPAESDHTVAHEASHQPMPETHTTTAPIEQPHAAVTESPHEVAPPLPQQEISHTSTAQPFVSSEPLHNPEVAPAPEVTPHIEPTPEVAPHPPVPPPTPEAPHVATETHAAPPPARVEQVPPASHPEAPAAVPDMPHAQRLILGQHIDGGLANESPFTNAHNLTIDPRTPHVYSDDHGQLTVFGGLKSDRIMEAQLYVKAHPDAVVRLDTSFVDPTTQEIHLDISEVRMMGNQMSMHGSFDSPELQNVPFANPEDFTRELSA